MKQGKFNYKAAFLVLVVLGIVGMVAYFSGYSLSTVKDKLPASTGASTDELSLIQPSVTATARDVENDTLATGTGTAYINGAKQSITLGTSFNVVKGAEVEVIFDDAQHYYARQTFSAPASGNVPKELQQTPNGTLTGTFINSVGTASSAQTLTANDQKYVKVLLAGTNLKTFSNPDSPENPVICFDYNTTAFDSLQVVGAQKVDVPAIAVGTYEECYSAPFNHVSSGGEETIKIFADAGATAPAHDSTMIIYDRDLYVKTLSDAKGTVGARIYGVNNDAKADIGGVNPTVTLDWT